MRIYKTISAALLLGVALLVICGGVFIALQGYTVGRVEWWRCASVALVALAVGAWMAVGGWLLIWDLRTNREFGIGRRQLYPDA